MTTLAHLLTDLLDADPQAVATFDVAGDLVLPTTRRELADRVRALRAELQAVGVTDGQCIAVLLPNWSDTIVWQFAATELGAHVIGVNTRYNTREIAHILVSARPCVVAVADRFHGLDLFSTLSDALNSVESANPPAVAVVRGPAAPAEAPDPGPFDLGGGAWNVGSADTGTVRVAATPNRAATTAAGLAAGTLADDPLAVAFTTSGSTGTPKLAAHRESAVVGHAHADAIALRIEPGDVALCVLPVSGVFGFNTALAGLAGGAALLMEPVFDAATTLSRMESLRVTHIVGGDDLYGRLHDQWQSTGDDLSSLKVLGIADFLGRSHEIARWARDQFGALTTGVFGSSEVFSLMLLWDLDDVEKLRWTGGGRPVSENIEIRIADPFDDSVLPNGEQGELQVRGPNVVDAYLGNPGAAAAAFTADGWFRSGDLGTATGDGGYSYVCRMGDVLRLRGFLVDPAEIEHRLAEHAGVRLAKVVGITAAGGYTQAIAFVVPSGTAPLDSAELKSWCASSLAAFKVPSAVHIIEEMPTTVGGNGNKIRAVELREWAQQWTDHERDFRHA
ncbi:AMP-binding protein [Rhodococcus sp. IEGM 1379]|uniref:AMP-binding protein n=1 Tax=Rhodococcus sp. IEGM 1379 TaxID=3047086 RepID=UPI0024B7527A|nr:AMP-binding protein [Rhodococcus sp. IEGM 1379]MDI9915644.1 AMP-binding protein [Rhodococcus sp. IEGM 1379]